MRVMVDPKKCPHNHKCPSIAVCPQKAIKQKTTADLPEIDEALCSLCGKCIKRCPKKAFVRVEGASDKKMH